MKLGIGASEGNALFDSGRALNAGITTIVGAGVSKLTTGHSNFSWANVASASVVAGLGGKLPGEAGTVEHFISDVGVNIGRSAVGYGVNRLLGGNRHWRNDDVLADAFGNAIGNSIVGKLQERENTKKLQEQISKSFANVKVQGADDLSAYLPEHDLAIILLSLLALNFKELLWINCYILFVMSTPQLLMDRLNMGNLLGSRK